MTLLGTVDVLAALHEGRMTLAEVERQYGRVMASPRAGEAAALLGLTNVEWTAFCQGAHWDDLARFRHAGWPRACTRCGGALDVPAFGWRVQEEDGGVVLVHVTCP